MSAEFENLKNMMSLIRDNRFDDAWKLLDSLLVTDPEQVAQWYLLSRFVARGDERFGEGVRGALGELGRAATHAFDGILERLKAHTPTREKTPDVQDVGIQRLESFFGAIQGRYGERVQDSRSGEVDRLLIFLERMQKSRVEELGPVRRVEQRLDGLRNRMTARGGASGGATTGRHRLASRLTAFGRGFGGTKKRGGGFAR